MSIANQQRRGTCAHCGDDHPVETGVGSYCSTDCRERARGASALRNIEHDHRFCSTCYKPLKVVFRPADRESPKLRKKALVIRESFVGFQDFTEFAESGDFGLECSCGNVDHYHHEPDFRDGEPYEWYLKLAITKFRQEGQTDDRFDLETFADEFWTTDDLELAVGRALE